MERRTGSQFRKLEVGVRIPAEALGLLSDSLGDSGRVRSRQVEDCPDNATTVEPRKLNTRIPGKKLGWNPMPVPVPTNRVELERFTERFMAKVSPEPNTGCWLWTACAEARGYGHFQISKKTFMAHRVAYWLFVGAIPDDLMCDHLCRVTSCVNPAHLELVDNRTNVLRGVSPVANAIRTGNCKHGHPLKLRRDGKSKRCLTCANIYGARVRGEKVAFARVIAAAKALGLEVTL